MKQIKNRGSRIFIILFLILIQLHLILADSEIIYRDSPIVPNSGNLQESGNLLVSLYDGNLNYNHNLIVPSGTNNLKPLVLLNYGSHLIGQKPNILGSGGWSLTDNYILRDVNNSFSNISNDYFRLYSNGNVYDLVYNPSDGRYHTKIESYLFIENRTNGNNTNNQYFLLKDKDGTQYRFGYNNDSELISNLYTYTVKWSLDLVNDTYGNLIYYSYKENPYANDFGVVYPDKIEYNNDKKRKIEFIFESVDRPDMRIVYSQGNKERYSRRLKDIAITFNNSLVRKYSLDYSSFNNINAKSFISNISYYGADNSSLLSISNFSYSAVNSGWIQDESWEPPICLDCIRYSVIDVNRDGLVDFLLGANDGACNSDDRTAYINTGSGWAQNDSWEPPICLDNSDYQFADVNGDGLVDILWGDDDSTGDDAKRAYLNNGNGWVRNDSWEPPIYLDNVDYRIVDINGDSLVDILWGDYGDGCNYYDRTAYINTGSGWIQDDSWAPPICLDNSRNALTDVNGDGLVDILWGDDDGTCNYADKTAYINTGSGWIQDESWEPPICLDNSFYRIADVNGDGLPDFLWGYDDGACTYADKTAYINNVYHPYLLKNITSSFGGTTSIDYKKSTLLNNTGNDSLSELGFNVWVVSNITKNNSISGSQNVVSVVNYNYSGGKYDYQDKEFRGFNYVEENTDSKIIRHWFYQDDALKGLEYKSEILDPQSNIYLRNEKIWNYTNNGKCYVVNLLETSESTYNRNYSNPQVKNVSYNYDNFGNTIMIHNKGDVLDSSDDKYEYFNYLNNSNSWIINKIINYSLFNYNNSIKLKEIKYNYDKLQYGVAPNRGDITSKQFWLNASQNFTYNYSYDTYGNLVNETNSRGYVTQYVYGLRDTTNTLIDRIINAKGQITDYNYSLGTGNLLWDKDSNGQFTNYTYDVFGRITQEIKPYDNSTFPTTVYIYSFDGIAPEKMEVSKREQNGTQNTLDQYYFYDGFGNIIQTKSEADGNKQIVKDAYYDTDYRISLESNPYFVSFFENYSSPNQTVNKINYTYNPLNQITKLTNMDNTSRNMTYNGWNFTYYDENGNRKDYDIDAYNKIKYVREYSSGSIYNTTYFYDTSGNLIKIVDSLGNIFNWSYDALDRNTKIMDPDIGTLNYSYDGENNLIEKIDNKGNKIIKGYDQLNRVLYENSSTRNITYIYDLDKNNSLSQVRINNMTINNSYDNRLREISEKKVIDGITFSTNWTYDSMDRITTEKLPSGETIVPAYNNQGLTYSISNLVNISYNEQNQILSRSYGNNLITNYSYNGSNFRLTQIKTGSKQELNYIYDSLGNVKQINDSINLRFFSMNYDNLNRLIFTQIINFSGNNDNKVINFSYNSIGNLLQTLSNSGELFNFSYNQLAHAPSHLTVSILNISSVELALFYPSVNLNVTKNQFFPFIINITCKYADCGEVNVSLDPESAEANEDKSDKKEIIYTPSSETTCNGNKCTKIIYSGIRFVNEDNQWKKIEDARSLKDKGFEVVYLENDSNFIVNVIDYNLTSITIELETNLNDSIPVRIWKQNESKKIEKRLKEKDEDKDNYREIFDKDYDNAEVFTEGENKKTKTYEMALGDILEFGYNSTTLLINSSSGDGWVYSYSSSSWVNAHDATNGLSADTTGDLYLYSYTGTGANAYLMRIFLPFNTSDLPDGAIIEKASLYFNVIYYPALDMAGARQVVLVNTSQPDISTLTTADIDNAGAISNPAEGANRVTITGTGGQTFELNATGISWINKTGYTKLGLRTWLDADNQTPINDVQEMNIHIGSSESATNYPYLNITYTESGNTSIKSGLVSAVTGTTPFYTNQSNPRTINLSKDQSQLVTFWVNATGNLNTTHKFFAFANLTSNTSINSMTSAVNITIVNLSNGSSGSWWNASWTKKKEIKIQEKSNKAQVNYSVLLTIPYDSDMNASFKDLRFTNGSENAQLKYYIDSQTNSSIANVWVLIPNLAPNINTTIYMYYGNPTTTSNSNRNEAFLLFEDFGTNPFTGTRGWNCWDATCTYDSTNKWVNLSAGSGFASAIMSYNLSNYSNVEIKFQEFGLNSAYWFALETRSAQSGGGVINQRYYGHTTPAVQTITGPAWAVSSSFLSKSNYTVAWYNFSSTVTTQNYTAKNETRLENTTAGAGYGVQDNSYINFHGRSSSQIAIDDVRVRRYTLPEPSYYISNEESH